jgi:hypothetical protein
MCLRLQSRAAVSLASGPWIQRPRRRKKGPFYARRPWRDGPWAAMSPQNVEKTGDSPGAGGFWPFRSLVVSEDRLAQSATPSGGFGRCTLSRNTQAEENSSPARRCPSNPPSLPVSQTSGPHVLVEALPTSPVDRRIPSIQRRDGPHKGKHERVAQEMG